MIMTFCGHRNVTDNECIRKWLHDITEQFILNGASVFYLGGYGEFDKLAKSVMGEHKKIYPNIEIVLILPYLNHSLDETGYCYTLYPPLETVPKRFAILKRNQWMIEQSDIVVAYVTHGWGGAAKTLEFAQRKNKQIILYAPHEKNKN